MLTRKEALQLEGVTGPDLFSVCQSAGVMRDKHFGKVLTYSRKVFIPLTNMCRDTCGYCTFVKTPKSGQGNIMLPAEVLETVLKGQGQGCKEALFSLGEKPEARYRYAKDKLAMLGHDSMLDYVKEQAQAVLDKTDLLPHINAGAMSLTEMRGLKPVAASMGMMIESTSQHLMNKGQAHFACPDKEPKVRLNTLRYAGQLDIPFTTGILIGIGETWQDRIDSLLAINQIHQEYGHIQEVIVQNFRAKAGTEMANHPEPNLDDMRRTLALARLILDPSISLQAPPNLEERYGSYVSAGINDWGGISPVTQDFINPERAWPQIDSLAKACLGLGYELKERLTVYPHYLEAGSQYLDPALALRMPYLAAQNGLAAKQWKSL
ncbi:radical SAM domain protein [Marinomonas sp. MED121]|uniref:7,8-didemethyl-8-hydroxy-5-deazariboflavin synthase CofG n=1 Tax=Marinomonas sp. MED121 TaxID=314277 RepID=UPI000068FF67|nr:7,8-didemethyl-8-hydroxy-5-deazariboflavin synthase CofG [Marinomonas sp. MED121]EAQ67050.1 radical SAM domain protein [Marinomonas sp. MED121]